MSLAQLRAIAGLLLAVIGLGGLPDDLAKWKEWIGATADLIPWTAYRTVNFWLLLIGLFLLVSSVSKQRWQWVIAGIVRLYRHDPAETDQRSALFFIDRWEMDKATGGLEKEIAGVNEMWLATNTAIYPADRELFSRGRRITRLVLLDPDGQYLSVFAPQFERTKEDLQQQIRMATRRAQKSNVEVRWFDGPLVGLVIADPAMETSWVRTEIYVPRSTRRPGMLFKKAGQGKEWEAYRDVFLRIWENARLAPQDRAEALTAENVPREMAAQIADMQREREATDTFPLVQDDLGVRHYNRGELDEMSLTQRNKLFKNDGAMEFWWRGRKNNGSWAMVRLEGGKWFKFQELQEMSEADRNTVLGGYGRGVVRKWYLDQIKTPDA